MLHEQEVSALCEEIAALKARVGEDVALHEPCGVALQPALPVCDNELAMPTQSRQLPGDGRDRGALPTVPACSPKPPSLAEGDGPPNSPPRDFGETLVSASSGVNSRSGSKSGGCAREASSSTQPAGGGTPSGLRRQNEDAVPAAPQDALSATVSKHRWKPNSSIRKLIRSTAEEAELTPIQMLHRMMEGPIDRMFSIAIVTNVVFMCAELEYRGFMRGMTLGYLDGEKDGSIWKGSTDRLFVIGEHIFNIFFLIEIYLRLAVLRRKFWYDEEGIRKANIFDLVLVIASSLDLYIPRTEARHGASVNLNVLRPFRFLRLFRTLRVLQAIRLLDPLRVLVNTVFASFISLFWSIALLTIVMLLAALFMAQSLIGTLEDQDVDAAVLEWVYMMYGTTGRSFNTLFELTFSGGWPNYTSTIVHHVNWWYGVFFFIYIIAVTFAMFRIITALFLKDTLEVTANDAEYAVREKIKQRESYTEKLLEFFHAADLHGEGFLTFEKFQSILEQEQAKTWLSIMEVDVRDSNDFFHFLADERGVVTPDKFVKGIMRLKGGAKSQDIIALQRGLSQIQCQIRDLSDSRLLHVGMPTMTL